MDNAKSGICYWRASVGSETLTGVTQSKIGDVYLFIYWRASEASETLSGVTQSRFRYFIYLSVYGVRETSVFARAFNYVS